MLPVTALRPSRPALAVALLIATAASLSLAPASPATVIAQRTELLGAQVGQAPAGASANPSVTAAGDAFAFDSVARNLPGDGNGVVRDVFRVDAARNVSLVSGGLDGAAANGPSGDPTISGDGRVVVFGSTASNLVAADTNASSDVFARLGAFGTALLSRALDGGPANGISDQPDVSANGRYVVFRSTASNLVAGDTNGRADVFVRDLLSNRTALMSSGPRGVPGKGDAAEPAISADGRRATFFSTAANLVRGDVNRGGDVFYRDLQRRSTQLVSRATDARRKAGTLQVRRGTSTAAQVSSLSRDGRFVAFDSDAANLVEKDTNRAVDVFVRDRRRGVTARVSVDSSGTRQARGSSFLPRITPDGRFVAFQSLARNLAVGDSPREDTFVYDRRLRATSVVGVGAAGQRAAPLSGPRLRQQPSLSADAHVVTFTSTSPQLTAVTDTNAAADAFVRRMDPPATLRVVGPPAVGRSARPRVRFAADDPGAIGGLCVLDKAQDVCPFSFRPLRVRDGFHDLSVHAGGPGMLFDPVGVSRRFSAVLTGPYVEILLPKFKRGLLPTLRRISGRATDRGYGIRRVQVWITALGADRRTAAFDGRRFVRRSGRVPKWVTVRGTAAWSVALPELPLTYFTVRVRAIDKLGRRGRQVKQVYLAS